MSIHRGKRNTLVIHRSVLSIRCNYKRFVLALSLFVLCCNVQAVTETMLADGFVDKLTRFMNTHGRRGQLLTPDKHRISFQRFDQPCNDIAVVVVPGWSESYLKYAELIYDLRQYHYCVYTYDHRGQGLSSRNLADTEIGDVQDFAAYADDLQQVDQQIVRSKPHRKVYIVAHSMGGLVALQYAAQSQEPITGLVLTAPMLKIRTDFWPEKVAYAIVSLFNWLGLGTHYVLGQGDWQRPHAFRENRVTHSRIRYAMGTSLLRRDPSLIIAGVSNRWLKTALEHTWKLNTWIPLIRQKILLFQAGEEQLVVNSAEDKFCALARHCSKVQYAHARHEILMERDQIRDDVLRRITEFMQ